MRFLAMSAWKTVCVRRPVLFILYEVGNSNSVLAVTIGGRLLEPKAVTRLVLAVHVAYLVIALILCLLV